MMRLDRLTAAELAQRLEMAGQTPHPDLIAAIAARRDALEPLLLATFRESLHDNWSDPEDPRWYRLVHTGRFMIAWQTRDALPTFAQLFSADDEATLDICEWFEEDLAFFGPAAVPILFSIVSKDAGGEWHYGKGLSGSTLGRIATCYPEVRDAVVAHFRAQLPDPRELPRDHDEMWGEWAMELAELGDDGSRKQILALDALGVLGGISYERDDYLKRLDRGFTPQEPPGRYDIVADYRVRHQHAQEARRREAEKKRLERQQRMAAAQPPVKKKTGRNEPCPCGSGLKYKKCHGRPDAR